MSRPGIEPVTSRSLECTLYLLRYWGWLLYGMAWRARNGVLYGLVGTVGYLVWPSVHGKVYTMAWKASQGTGRHCMVYELQHDKTNKITCSPRSAWASGQSDVHMKKPLILSYRAYSGCPGWSESSLGAHATLLVLSCCGSYGMARRGMSWYVEMHSIACFKALPWAIVPFTRGVADVIWRSCSHVPDLFTSRGPFTSMLRSHVQLLFTLGRDSK